MDKSDFARLFTWMAETLNGLPNSELFGKFDAANDGGERLQFSPLAGVVWVVKPSGDGSHLTLTQLAKVGEQRLTIHPETPFAVGGLQIGIDASDADAQTNIHWLLSKIGVTYAQMMKDPEALAEEGSNVFEVMGKVEKLNQLVQLAFELLNVNSFDDLVKLLDVRAPYRVASSASE